MHLKKQAFNVRECLVNAVIAHSNTRSRDRVDPVRDGHPLGDVAVPVVVVSRRGRSGVADCRRQVMGGKHYLSSASSLHLEHKFAGVWFLEPVFWSRV
jgi:hypothetical protein